MARIEFGTPVPINDLEAAISVAQEAESRGFDSIWMPDHMVSHIGAPDCFEALSVLAILSRMTERVRLGTGVTDPHRRNPGVLAQTVATIDISSKGRLITGLGAGEAMNLDPVGIPWDKPVSRLEECMPLLQRLWTEKYVDHDGKYYTIKNALIEPKPVQKPYPPMWLAANGPRTLRLTGKFCQGWLPGAIPPDIYSDDLAIIRESAKDANADWSKFEPGLWINTSVADSSEQAKGFIETSARMIALYMSHRFTRSGVDVPTEHSFLKHTVDDNSTKDLARSAEKVKFKDVESTVIYGTVDDCIHQIGEFVDAGARHFVVGSKNPPEHKDWFWDGYEKEIIPSFR